MKPDRDTLREWHRLFGLFLMDYLADSPFTVEVEHDLSVQQQYLDVVIVRRRPGRLSIQLPDGMAEFKAHNLITFKSRHESLDAWAMKELIGHYVAYRKMVSKRNKLLAEDEFRLYAVTARYPQNLVGQIPWREQQQGVYDCEWGTDTVRVIVAGELPKEVRNAPLHLFSASGALVGFGQAKFERRSQTTSRLLDQLAQRLGQEGFSMSFTMQDFEREYNKKNFLRLSPKERREAIESLPLEERLALAGLSEEEIREYVHKHASRKAETSPKLKRKK